MAKDKIPPHKVEMTEGKREIIKGLLSEYDIQSAEDIEEHEDSLVLRRRTLALTFFTFSKTSAQKQT